MIYPQLHNMIIQTIMPNLVAKQFLTYYKLSTGNAVTFAKQSGSPGAVADEISEGSEIPLDVTSYSQVVVVPKKVGQGLIITRETIEDAQLPVQADQLMRKALIVANKIDKDKSVNSKKRPNHSKFLKEKHWTEERKEKYGQLMKEKWKDKKFREKTNKNRNKAVRTEEYHKNSSKAHKAKFEDEDFREKHKKILEKVRSNPNFGNLVREGQFKSEKWHTSNKRRSKMMSDLWSNSNFVERIVESRKYKNTDIELIMQKALKDAKLEFKNNVHIKLSNGKYCIPDHVNFENKIAIFDDGKYWHNYPFGTERDNYVTKILSNDGWTVLRFWDEHIYKQVETCIDIIRAFYFPEIIDTIDSGASGSVTASGKSLALDGTEFVLSGSGGPGLGYYDISDAKVLVENNNYIPDTLLVHPRAKRYLERLPHFTAAFSVGGSGRMTTGLPAQSVGNILGLDVFVSTNCGTGSAYVLCRGASPTITGQYGPLGFFVDRRPVTTEVQAMPSRDSMGIFITTRYGVTVTKGEAACKIASINVS